MEKANRNRLKGFWKVLMIIGIVIVTLIVIAAIFLILYRHNNLHFDDHYLDKTFNAGYVEKQVNYNGAVINFTESPDNGTPVILIHGQGMAWEDYAKVLPALSENHHVFAIDCFGHGGSEHNPALYSCVESGKAVAFFIENIIGEPVILSGHSSGGIIAAWVAANAPDKVSALLLEDPPFFEVTPAEMQEGTGCFVWKDSFTVVHDFLQQNDQTDYSLYYLENSYFVGMFGGLRPVMVDMAKQWRVENPAGPIKLPWIPHSWIHGIYYIDEFDLRFGETFYDGSFFDGVDQAQMLKHITCPTIYLKATTNYAEDGTLLAANTEEDAEMLMSCLQNADYSEMRSVKSGHDIHYEKPEIFIQAINDCADAMGI
jgi:pimeloyl-ACP methyl ester carboxylesterase